MFKKLIFIIPLAFATLLPLPVYADSLDEVNTEVLDEPTDTQSSDPSIIETPAPLGEQETTNNSESTTEVTTNDSQVNSPEEVASLEGTTTNPIFSDIKEKIEEVVDPENWPLILSAAALVLTIILILTINLIAHNKSKKIREEIENQ